MKELLSGTMVMMYITASLFFLKFWKTSRDSLFACFAAAFWILGVQYLALAIAGENSEHSTWFYGTRLVAFLLILTGIWAKNRRPSP